jgi:hypothetical protein
LSGYYDKLARERMQVRKGDQPGASPVNLPGLSDARDAAGKEFGVSGKSVDHATKVLEVLPRARGPNRFGGKSAIIADGAPTRAWAEP